MSSSSSGSGPSYASGAAITCAFSKRSISPVTSRSRGSCACAQPAVARVAARAAGLRVRLLDLREAVALVLGERACGRRRPRRNARVLEDLLELVGNVVRVILRHRLVDRRRDRVARRLQAVEPGRIEAEDLALDLRREPRI